jgi:F-type H+-transporting ATPase subunit b
VELNATFFLQLAVFFTLLAWLSPVLFDPFLRLFEERARRIEGAAADAKLLAGSAEERTALIAQRTAEAQIEARTVLTTLRARALEREKEIISAAREQASARLDEARADLFEATEEARRSLKDDAKALSADIVQKVLGRAA